MKWKTTRNWRGTASSLAACIRFISRQVLACFFSAPDWKPFARRPAQNQRHSSPRAAPLFANHNGSSSVEVLAGWAGHLMRCCATRRRVRHRAEPSRAQVPPSSETLRLQNHIWRSLLRKPRALIGGFSGSLRLSRAGRLTGLALRIAESRRPLTDLAASRNL